MTEEHHALALSGGAASGAWQAGVVAYLLGEKRRRYQTVTGVSVGALNGARLAEHPLGREYEAAKELVADWESIKSASDIYKPRFLGMLPSALIWALFRKRGVYRTYPLVKRVKEGSRGRPPLDAGKMRSSDKRFVCGAVEWGSGTYRTWDEQSPDIIDAVLASAAFPVFFESVKVGAGWYTDGGARTVTPIRAAIDQGATHITVVSCSPEAVGKSKVDPRGLDQAKRALGIALDEVDIDDFKKAMLVNELVRAGAPIARERGWRLVELEVIRPERGLGDSLDFSPDKNRRLIDQGYDLVARTLG